MDKPQKNVQNRNKKRTVRLRITFFSNKTEHDGQNGNRMVGYGGDSKDVKLVINVKKTISQRDKPPQGKPLSCPLAW